MKLASFIADDRLTYGVLKGELLQEPGDALRSRYPDLRSLLAAGAELALQRERNGAVHDVESVRFVAVLPNPDKILCVGVNYRPHVEEMGRESPEYPVVFVRFPDSLVGHGQPVIRPLASDQYDFEGELAVVIGKVARHIPRAAALDYVAGYSCFMDGSVRDWQRHSMQFTAGKNFNHSGSMGPWLVTRDEIADPETLLLTTRVNGRTMQQGRLEDLIFDIPQLIEYCSTFTQLLPGDVIATGTPGGVGAARRPPVWLRSGDSVEVDIPGLGCLLNPVRDEQGPESS